jgi:diguanylate cyclase (GGDEF)-like protein
VLRFIGASVASLLRTEDVFARYGGEEFVVVARGLSLKQGVKLGERIRKALEAQVLVFEKRRFRVTISAGISELSEQAVRGDPNQLMLLADGRLYSAKAQGRNRVVSR